MTLVDKRSKIALIWYVLSLPKHEFRRLIQNIRAISCFISLSIRKYYAEKNKSDALFYHVILKLTQHNIYLGIRWTPESPGWECHAEGTG